MKILIISGFLGAGKTTFIKEMSRKIQRDFVVMENEYGETNMDSAFLKRTGKLKYLGIDRRMYLLLHKVGLRLFHPDHS